MSRITENKTIVGMARWLVAFPNRIGILEPFARGMMRAMARFSMDRVGAKPANDLVELFDEWKRSSPALADYQLVRIEGDKVFAEIHSNCALRGTGNRRACERMMEYDFEVMRAVGGQLQITSSQSNNGKTHCSVVLKMKASS